MSDFILIEGDKAIFEPNFGVAVVAVRPGEMTGSGKAVLSGKRICVDGDEQRVSVPGCIYTTPQHSIPGTGTLKIAALKNQRAVKTKTGGKAVLLTGSGFVAKFEVQNPAMQPPPGPGSPVPDSTAQYSGSGAFVSTNSKIRGT